ncbi:MAG: gliding motility lipoprotein GldH [Bacteroidota bacterium]
MKYLKKYNYHPFLLMLFITILASCDKKTIYNQNKDFENGKWKMEDECKFEFTIDDTTQTYKLYYNVRNNLSYPYYNLYVTRYLYDEKGVKLEEKLEELMLADEKTGKPSGTGLGDIFDHKILINKALKFSKKGKYTLKIKQFMRQNPLPDVLSFGIAIEKSI